MILARLLSAALVLASASGYGVAQDLDFKDLPGVIQQTGPSVNFNDTGSSAAADCTTAYEVHGTESNTPKRVYKCRKGNITITSDVPPEGY